MSLSLDFDIAIDYSRPFPEVAREDDVIDYKHVATGAYNIPAVFGAFVYREITLTQEQLETFAALHFRVFGPGRGDPGLLDLSSEIFENEKWEALRTVVIQIDAIIRTLDSRVSIRCDDMSPKDAVRKKVQDEIFVQTERLRKWMGDDGKDRFDEGLSWAERFATHRASVITNAAEAIDILLRSTRVFVVAQSYHFHNEPFHLYLSRYDDQIDQGQEFRCLIDSEGDIFGISTYAGQENRILSRLIPSDHGYVQLIAKTIKEEWNKKRDYIIRERVILKKLMQQILPPDVNEMIASYWVDHRRAADFCVKVDTNTMQPTYVRFIECNPLLPITGPCNFATKEEDAAELDVERRDIIRKRFDYRDVYALEGDNRRLALANQPKRLEVRISRLTLRAAFESTHLASQEGIRFPQGRSYIQHKAEFNRLLGAAGVKK